MKDRQKLPPQLLILFACSFSVALGYGILAPVLPVLARSYGVSFSAAGLVVSAFALARLLFAPLASRLVSARGETLIYMSGLLIVALSTAGAAFAPNFPLLVFLRSLGGIGSTMFTVAGTGLLIRLAPPEHRGKASAAFGGAFITGNILGPAIGGIVAGWGLRAPFFVYSIMLVLSASLMGLSLLVNNRARQKMHVAPQTQEAQPLGIREAWKDTRYRSVVSGFFANGFVVFGVRVSLFPLLAISVAELPSPAWDPLGNIGALQLTGMVMTAFAIGALSALPFSGQLADRWGRSRPALIGLAGIALSFTLAGWASHASALLLFSFLGGVSEAIFSPASNAALADVLGKSRGGNALAAPQMAADVGAIIGPILGGFMVDTTNFAVALSVVALIPAIASLLWLKTRLQEVAQASSASKTPPVTGR